MDDAALKGRCTCGEVVYEMQDTPLFVHCCHCTWCQRETGSAFVINALIESAKLAVVSGSAEAIDLSSESGHGQRVYRCPTCRVALWSQYLGAGDLVSFVRAGTLDNPAACPPDIHIYTSTKLPWVVLPDGVPAMEGFYRRSEMWPEASLVRRAKALEVG